MVRRGLVLWCRWRYRATALGDRAVGRSRYHGGDGEQDWEASEPMHDSLANWSLRQA
jgi:hypothetical protein